MGSVDVEAIEERAREVLAGLPEWLWDGESCPVPVEAIADSHFGLLVRDVADLSTAPGCPPLGPEQSLSGLLLAAAGEIWVNADEGQQWPGRRRFTICHELGHHVLHREADRDLFCRTAHVEPPDDRATADPGLPDIEEEASVFAAALLMPPALIRREYERDRDFFGLCERFGASGAAMGRRLHAVI